MKLFLLLCFLSFSESAPFSDRDVVPILLKYGYLKPSALSTDSSEQEDSIIKAIRIYQQKNGLDVSGEFNQELFEDMERPRCGMPDLESLSDKPRWDKSHITYYIQKYSKHLSRQEVKDAIRKAADTWSAEVPLTFEEVKSAAKADFKIGFEIDDHGDNFAFDGKGRILGHTLSGKKLVHFDDDEDWIYKHTEKLQGCLTKEYKDLYYTALHEFGHVLGLEHVFNQSSVMYAKVLYECDEDGDEHYIRKGLSVDDIALVQTLYGTHKSPKISGSAPDSEAPKECVTDKISNPKGSIYGSNHSYDYGNPVVVDGETKGIAWQLGPYDSYYAVNCDFYQRVIATITVGNDPIRCLFECYKRDNCFAWSLWKRKTCFLKDKFKFSEARVRKDYPIISGAWF